MASSPVKLTIPIPCSQPWQTMTPDQQGRFCTQCQKTVVDFSTMTDAQVVAHLQQAGSVGCGQFRVDQLNRVLLQPPINRVSRWQWAGILLSGWLSSQAVQAQTEPTTGKSYSGTFIPRLTTKRNRTTSPDTTSQGLITDSTMVLKGRVIDAASRGPVAGATVVFKNTVYGTTTDSTGTFRLTGPAIDLDSTTQLVASSIAYTNQELTLTAYMAGQPLLFTLNEDTKALNKVVRMGYVIVQKPTRWRRIRNWFRPSVETQH